MGRYRRAASPSCSQLRPASSSVFGPATRSRRRRSGAMLSQVQSSQDPSHTPPEYQKLSGLEKVMAGTIALSDGGCSTAASHSTAPGYDRPKVPTDPLDQGWRAAHSMVSYLSRPSCW